MLFFRYRFLWLFVFMCLNFSFNFYACNIESTQKVSNLQAKLETKKDVFTFEKWRCKCFNLPSPDKVDDGDYSYSAITSKELYDAIHDCLKATIKNEKNFSLEDINNWLENSLYKNKEIEKKPEIRYKYFAQKLDIKEQQVYVHADIHADIHSLITYFDCLFKNSVIYNNFKIVNSDNYFVFLGDYTDRGVYGAEVLYTIARFKEANPKNVLLLRGNHESAEMNINYGLSDELYCKFGDFDAYKISELLNKFYHCMPVAIFMGFLSDKEGCCKDYVLFCHGAIELGFNPNELLGDNRECLYAQIDKLDISWLPQDIKENILYSGLKDGLGCEDIRLEDLSFLWGDFCIEKKGRDSMGIMVGNAKNGPRGNVFSSDIVSEYFKACSSDKNNYSLRYVFRGHQHGGPMIHKMLKNSGFHNSWNSSDKEFGCVYKKLNKNFPVWTLNACPGSNYAFNVKQENKEKMEKTFDFSFDDDKYFAGDSFASCLDLDKINNMQNFTSSDEDNFISDNNKKEIPKYNYDTYAKLKIFRDLNDFGIEIHNLSVFK